MKKHFYCLFVLFAIIGHGGIFASTLSGNEYSGCCKPPYDKTVTCDQLPYDFNPYNTYQLQSLFGKAENKCYAGLWVELEPIVNLSNCETGTIIRRFQASNSYNSYDICEQIVTIVGVHNYKIRFPEDKELSCGETPLQEQVIKEQSSCDYLVVSVQDQKFFDGNSQCGKIFRTYRVINWCEYDGNSQPITIGRDEDCDNRPGDEQVWVIRRPSGIAYIDRDNNESNDNPRAGERRDCSPTNPTGYWRTSNSTGYWQYTQHIKIGDNTPPTIAVTQPNPICSYSNNCDALVEIPFSVDDICTPNDIKIKVFVDGNQIATFSKAGSYKTNARFAIGSHELEIHAIDGCGNPTVTRTPFSIVDCKAPTPICVNGITATLMPTEPNTDADGDGDIDGAAATIWVNDLLKSQVSDCSGIAGFSINRVGETPDFNQKSLVLTCDDPSTLDVEIYAWDKANNPYAEQPDSTVGGRNYSFCVTYVLIQDNNDRCAPAPGMGSISGGVWTEGNYKLQNVNIMLVSDDSTFQLTGSTGSYRFDSIPMQKDYKVIPVLDENPTEGLSIVDLILLQKHVLGIDPIRSPYHLIAADVTRDGRLDNNDVVELRNVLLGVQQRFTNNTSWRFIDASYVFPNPLNPWLEPLPEYILISRMSAAENYGNFLAIKTGDVNGSVIADRLNLANRSNAALDLKIAYRELVPGTTIKIPVSAGLTDVEALQFALQFSTKALQFIDIEPGVIPSSNFSTKFVNEGFVNVIWTNPQESSLDEKVLFTLIFKVNEPTSIKEAVSLSSKRTPPIAYVATEVVDLKLVFDEVEINPGVFVLHQNTPNPFHDATVIGFDLPEADQAILTIFDTDGKILWQQKDNFSKGYHKISVNRNLFPAHGLLFYSLKTTQHQAVRKMIVLP